MNELDLLMFEIHKKYHLVHNHHPLKKEKGRVKCEMKRKKKKEKKKRSA